MALLSAVKAGVFVVQAAGNTGPSPKSISSFSPWIYTVGAAAHDRVYSNSIMLGNNITIAGVGLARKIILSLDNFYFVVVAWNSFGDKRCNLLTDYNQQRAVLIVRNLHHFTLMF